MTPFLPQRQPRPPLKRTAIVARALVGALAMAVVMPRAYGGEIERVELTIPLGEFDTRAELTLPVARTGPVPGVLLIHGATPADMDFTITDFGGRVHSHILKDIAEHLSANGYAVLRYNKRYVKGPGDVDYAAYSALSVVELATDARTAFDALRARDEVNAERVFVYGWSEGSLIAGHLAYRGAPMAGVILQAPVALPVQAVFEHQIKQVVLPYIAEVLDKPAVDADDIVRVLRGEAGLMVKGYAASLLDSRVGSSGARIDSDLDRNEDGAIQLFEEAAPVMLDRVFAAYTDVGEGDGVAHLLARTQALKAQPALILHGDHDANVAVEGSRRLGNALGEHGELVVFPGLGHSLGAAPTAPKDNFEPIEDQALAVMTAWLDRATGPGESND